ncbi:MAG: hypothetical protein IIZ90_05900 [Bacteroidales bacterium]|nr:hypothetical protein [Bacteroidales bacterium]
MKKYLVIFAAIAAILSLAGSCSKGADSVITLVDEGSGHTVGVVIEYNTPISFLSLTKKSYEVPGYGIIAAFTSEKDPQEMLDENKASEKVQVVPRQGQNLSGQEEVVPPQTPSMTGFRESLRGKDGKYVLLLVRKKLPRIAPGAPADSVAFAKSLQESSSEVVKVRQVLDIKTAKGKSVPAWKEEIASSESIKIKMRHLPGMHGARRRMPHPGNAPGNMPSVPQAPVKK